MKRMRSEGLFIEKKGLSKLAFRLLPRNSSANFFKPGEATGRSRPQGEGEPVDADVASPRISLNVTRYSKYRMHNTLQRMPYIPRNSEERLVTLGSPLSIQQWPVVLAPRPLGFPGTRAWRTNQMIRM